jgi:hypothetical protein
MPGDRTDEFAKLPRGQRAAAISNARVDRARAAAAEILRTTFKHGNWEREKAKLAKETRNNGKNEHDREGDPKPSANSIKVNPHHCDTSR